MGTRAVIYCRISEDREGAGLGVARQEVDCRELVDRRGWSVAGLYVDNDISAYSGRPRPEYRRLLDDVAAGAADVIVAWHPDRLHRSQRELEHFIDVIEQAGAAVETVRAGTSDLSTPSGRAIARTFGAWARYEVEHAAERQRGKMRELAEAGKPHGGGQRRYGYQRDGVTVVEEEAAVIREAAKRVLAGETLRGITRDLNGRGVPTVTGAAWSSLVLKAILTSARIAGQRERDVGGGGKGNRGRLGEIVGDAVWPAIISEEQSAALRAMLSDPARRTNAQARRYLLTGLLFCCHCALPLLGVAHAGVRRYACVQRPNGAGCARTHISAPRTDEHVVDLVKGTLLNSSRIAEFARADENAADAEIVERLGADEAKLAQLAADYADDIITRAEWLAARSRLEQRIEEARRRLASRRRTNALDGWVGMSPEELDARWDDPTSMTDDKRRAVITALIEKIVVTPPARRGGVFDTGRLADVRWRA